MIKNKRWTKEEDEILVQAIKTYSSKQEAFRQASKELNRPIESCSYRWYQQLSNEYSKNYIGTSFTLVGIHRRVKNNSINCAPVIKKNLWYKLKRLFKL